MFFSYFYPFFYPPPIFPSEATLDGTKKTALTSSHAFQPQTEQGITKRKEKEKKNKKKSK